MESKKEQNSQKRVLTRGDRDRCRSRGVCTPQEWWGDVLLFCATGVQAILLADATVEWTEKVRTSK